MLVFLKKNENILSKILTPLSIIFFVIVVFFSVSLTGENYFAFLAESFLHGKSYFLQNPNEYWLDTTFIAGKYYSPHGPFPAIVLVPFVFISGLFGLEFYQAFLQPMLVLGVFIVCYKIARLINYKKNDSIFLAFAFCFSTVFMGSALWPGFIAHTITSLLLFVLIYGYLKNFSPYLMGGTIGMVFLTRVSALASITFPILSIFFGIGNRSMSKKSKLLKVILPILISVVIFGLYNELRFGNFFEFGYSNAYNLESTTKAREYGVLSPSHLPGNLYYFFLASPRPVFRDGISHVLKFPFVVADPWGMSIFITSPIFIYLFFLSYKDKLSKLLIITVVTIAVPVFFYYGIGFRQFGYRYSLDFLPFLFFLLIRNYKRKYINLSSGFKLVVIISALTNLYFFLTAF